MGLETARFVRSADTVTGITHSVLETTQIWALLRAVWGAGFTQRQRRACRFDKHQRRRY